MGKTDAPFSDAIKAGALLFVGSAEFLFGLEIARAFCPNFNVSTTTMSEMAAGVFQPSSNIFNFSVIIFGVLTLLGAYFTMKAFHWWPLVGALLLAGVGCVGVGLFPATEANALPHLISAVLGFFFSGLSAVLSFKVVDSPFRYFAVVLGIVALVGFVLFMAGIDLGFGMSGESMIVYPAVLWYVSFGAYIMSRRDQSL